MEHEADRLLNGIGKSYGVAVVFQSDIDLTHAAYGIG